MSNKLAASKRGRALWAIPRLCRSLLSHRAETRRRDSAPRPRTTTHIFTISVSECYRVSYFHFFQENTLCQGKEQSKLDENMKGLIRLRRHH